MIDFNNFFGEKIICFVTDSSFDFSFEKDQNSLSLGQKRNLKKHLGSEPENCVNINQVHGNEILVLTKKEDYHFQKSDGIITNLFDVPILIRTADCLPVFIYSENKKCICLLHCGWKPSHKRIAQNALEILKNKFECDPKELKAAFGPAIRKCCYKVGPEFREYFPESIQEISSGFMFDLVNENRNQLINEGMLNHNIFDSGICTFCDENYFSYRRDNKKAGRMLSFMMQKN